MTSSLTDTFLEKLKAGTLVPYLGPGVLKYVRERTTNALIPADSDSLIYGMTGGQAMSPRLMYEFPRAAMHLENKKGRKFIERYLTTTYAERQWQASEFHAWLASLHLPYVIDINRDQILPTLYQDREHLLVVGAARLAGTHYRFDIHHYVNGSYTRPAEDFSGAALPILFKPYGCPVPTPSYVASDADFVDYITELMGGFAIPAFMKQYRKQKQYLFTGVRFNRDTERMVMSEIIFDADTPAGWALLPDASDKEQRFCATKKVNVVSEDWDSVLYSMKTAEVA